ncbi:MAG: DEAD/DEAH box helicase family protein, partial [Clostridia bacterium]|nr:DEAD/DEAH box helicase family protein [Clostridia bacterium]
MNGFENIHFKGSFRSYQQRVLDRAKNYLRDGKINIVAAPGSGKTVLGLELIRRIGKPCIIFSPTTSIRRQWGDRFCEMFLEQKDAFDGLFSDDLHCIRLVNSITYQALYTAIEKVSVSDGEDTDCSDVDLLADIKAFGIGTICLDEAHHLKNEWQKALEKFISLLPEGIKIISLTATPPYDAEGTEWSRYVAMCGEIDEEIFVPELVGQNTLCPHQDYVYFNYPTAAESESFFEQRERAALALEELRSLPLFEQVRGQLHQMQGYEELFSHV